MNGSQANIKGTERSTSAEVRELGRAPKPRQGRSLERLRLLARARGVTLIEILIVLAIVGLIAGGIAVFAIPKFKEAQVATTKQSAQQLHTIAEGWHAIHTQECPTADLLKKEKEIATTSNINDAWGKPFKIDCLDDGDVVVTSFGPDGKENTADDIRVPEAPKS